MCSACCMSDFLFSNIDILMFTDNSSSSYFESDSCNLRLTTLFTANFRPVSSGDISSSISCPYSGIAASMRSVSLAPSPHGISPSSFPASKSASHIFSAFSLARYNSTPSSPVYPVLEMIHGIPATSVSNTA